MFGIRSKEPKAAERKKGKEKRLCKVILRLMKLDGFFVVTFVLKNVK